MKNSLFWFVCACACACAWCVCVCVIFERMAKEVLSKVGLGLLGAQSSIWPTDCFCTTVS